MYKIETHLHTLYGAGCGKMEEKEIVSRYLDAGYAAVVVTDHYNRRTSWYPEFCADRSQNAAVLFLRGFRKVQEEGARRGLRGRSAVRRNEGERLPQGGGELRLSALRGGTDERVRSGAGGACRAARAR